MAEASSKHKRKSKRSRKKDGKRRHAKSKEISKDSLDKLIREREK